MVLPLAKVTLLIGAGILGSVLAKENGPNVSDMFSGAFKIVWKQIKSGDSPSSSGKPRNDSLIAQVKDLQKQLQDLVHDNKPVIVYSGSRSGIKIFGGPVVGVLVVGVGCMWWKGWKFSDMMFATRRGLSDACSSVGKQLDQVTSSVSAAKRHLSLRIDRVDINLDECAEITADTRDEVSQLRGDMRVFSVDVESVHRAVQSLETKIGRIEEKQEYTIQGVDALCNVAETMKLQASPSSNPIPALEHPGITTPLRSISLPPKVLALESPSTSSNNESPKVKRRLVQSTSSVSGLKVLEGLSESSMNPESTPVVATDSKSSGGSSRFGWKLPGLSAPFFRTNSVTLPFQ